MDAKGEGGLFRRVPLGNRSGVVAIAARLQSDLAGVAPVARAARVQCDDAAEPASVFCWNAGRENVHGFEFIVLEGRCKPDRAVIVERDAVDHILRVVFRPARMQHGVGFQQPAGHRGHHINGASSQGCPEGLVELLPSRLQHHCRLRGVQQRRRVGNGDFRGDHADSHRDLALLRYRRADLHSLLVARETRALDYEGIDPGR